MAERPGDRFLSNYTSADLQMRTGFSKKQIATFHRHYLDCGDAVKHITPEEKEAFKTEFGLEDDPVADEMLANLNVERPMHFDEYLQALSFMKNKQGGRPIRFRYVFQVFASSDQGASLDDLVELLKHSLPENLLKLPRAESRIYTWCKKHFARFDANKDGFMTFSEFQKFMRLENGIFTASDIEVNVAAISRVIKKRRRQTEILEKLVATLRR